MTPLPKRKFSTMRTGRRRAARASALPDLVTCKNCGKPKMPHRLCIQCHK